MNKPYFTKYLPVEGEINERNIKDDEFFYTEGRLFKRLAGSWALATDGTKSQYPVADRVQRAKLFLCSRDIQVGDKFNDDSGIINCVCTSRETSWLYSEGKWEEDSHHIENCYKVIGEVSPNAIWVKEGMEFEDTDIVVHHDGGIFYVKFQCPTCSTFH